MYRILPLILLVGFVLSSCNSYKKIMVQNQLHANDTFVFTEPVYLIKERWESRRKLLRYRETVSARLDSLFEAEGAKYRIAGKFVTADTSFTREVKRIRDNFKQGETVVPESVKRALGMADSHLMLFYFSPKLDGWDQFRLRSVMEVIIINNTGIVFYESSKRHYSDVVGFVDRVYKKLEQEL